MLLDRSRGGFAALPGLNAASTAFATTGRGGLDAVLTHALQQQVNPAHGGGKQNDGEKHG